MMLPEWIAKRPPKRVDEEGDERLGLLGLLVASAFIVAALAYRFVDKAAAKVKSCFVEAHHAA